MNTEKRKKLERQFIEKELRDLGYQKDDQFFQVASEKALEMDWLNHRQLVALLEEWHDRPSLLGVLL